ncbi:MAG: DUF4386 domain-containing protein [Terriglobales bacterium]
MKCSRLYIHTAFFGFWCVLIGYLIYKSTFLPRILGVLFALAGAGWMLYLSPPFALSLFPFIAALSAIGEVPLELWLMVKGVNGNDGKNRRSATLTSRGTQNDFLAPITP